MSDIKAFIRIGNVMRGIQLLNTNDSSIMVRDKAGKRAVWGSHILKFCHQDEYSNSRTETSLSTGIDNIARLCYNRLNVEFSHSRATLKDLRVVVECCLIGDYSKAFNTKLYKLQGVEYTRSLELINAIFAGTLTAKTVCKRR